MNDGNAERARAAIFEIIENQIELGTPPDTAETLNRLMSEGYSHEDAMKLIGCALSSEMYDMTSENREYDDNNYVQLLKALPRLPWE